MNADDNQDIADCLAALEAVDQIRPEEREAAFNRALNELFREENETASNPGHESPGMDALRVLAGYVTKH